MAFFPYFLKAETIQRRLLLLLMAILLLLERKSLFRCFFTVYNNRAEAGAGDRQVLQADPDKAQRMPPMATRKYLLRIDFLSRRAICSVQGTLVIPSHSILLSSPLLIFFYILNYPS